MAYGATKVQEKFNSSRLTHFGGVYLFHLFLKQIGWRNLHPFYKNLGYKKGICPQAENFYESAISLPIYFGLSQKDQELVISEVLDIIEK